ncbi:D-2-hydroxyacid dehydrogenase [Candidatus Epulonipiscium viviparus]|uniref:D-2-hydroxyacid dehydrogenase n=1 Tax=Candidatus Epulonipiscium viviparus TaxID=420336 RepID=UPI00016BFB3A|nr:D-2-hydroxyacid dehydrogenase [Candidatus Epulopiscium viviparus]
MQINIMAPNFAMIAERLKESYPEVTVAFGENNLENADIMFGIGKIERLPNLQNLKFVQLQSAGFDFLLEHKNLKHIKFASASGAYNDSISEHMLAMNLILFRHFNIHRDFQKMGVWQKWENVPAVRLIKYSTVLIIGMGEIGGAYAKLVKSMGAYVIGVRRSNLGKPDYADEVYLIDKLDDLLPRADVVAIAAPLNDETKHLIDVAAIAKMKDNAILINIARGAIVDTEALCDGLENGKLAGAALDVTDPEPLPADHRLWGIKSAIISPHCAGGAGKTGIQEAIIEIFLQNVARFIAGKKLINEITI